eukprot:TRINITY_DN41997_c0_g1_i1.p3 TRINITY_DN41997_c0_g1~~TRINITY_DN41997_c0_g1_i1.p3  ORF type:complete len:152 (-),score=18.08 TRINITY_DN41997_c0_g1_i1:232-687(-)
MAMPTGAAAGYDEAAVGLLEGWTPIAYNRTNDDDGSFWRPTSQCSLFALLGRGLGFFWLSGLGQRSYIDLEDEEGSNGAAEYYSWCSEHGHNKGTTSGIIVAAGLRFPPDFAARWIPPGFPADAPPAIRFNAEWPSRIALCAPKAACLRLP